VAEVGGKGGRAVPGLGPRRPGGPEVGGPGGRHRSPRSRRPADGSRGKAPRLTSPAHKPVDTRRRPRARLRRRGRQGRPHRPGPSPRRGRRARRRGRRHVPRRRPSRPRVRVRNSSTPLCSVTPVRRAESPWRWPGGPSMAAGHRGLRHPRRAPRMCGFCAGRWARRSSEAEDDRRELDGTALAAPTEDET